VEAVERRRHHLRGGDALLFGELLDGRDSGRDYFAPIHLLGARGGVHTSPQALRQISVAAFQRTISRRAPPPGMSLSGQPLYTRA